MDVYNQGKASRWALHGARWEIEVECERSIPDRLPIDDAWGTFDAVRECNVVDGIAIDFDHLSSDLGDGRRQLC